VHHAPWYLLNSVEWLLCFPHLGYSTDQSFSTADPRPGTGPSSYRKKNLPGRGLTKIENHCNRGARGSVVG
jgi:hypothetical protein